MKNSFRIDGNVAYIRLSGKHGPRETLIDAEDLPRVAAAFRSLHGTYYGYAAGRIEGGSQYDVFLHRFVMNAPAGMDVDHEHHRTLDNRKSELKVCTHQKNQINRRGAAKHSQSGVLNIYKHVCGKWGASITVAGVHYSFGLFTEQADAASEAIRRRSELANNDWSPPNTWQRGHALGISGVRGVYYSAKRKKNKWRARPKINGLTIHLGVFPSAAEAQAAIAQYQQRRGL